MSPLDSRLETTHSIEMKQKSGLETKPLEILIPETSNLEGRGSET